MSTPDRKHGRYIVGPLLALVGIWNAAKAGQGVGHDPTLQTIGYVACALATITMAVQALTDERYPNTRLTTLARIMLTIGIGLSVFGGRR